MFRPLLAFGTLCLAAFLLAPTVATVHEKVTELHIMRETPWSIFEWYDPPKPRLPIPECGGSPKHLYSEITSWPERIQKDEPFSLRGVVQSEEDGRAGVGGIDVDVYLNETKTKPGVFLGTVQSEGSGAITLTTSLPYDLAAARYHLVAHAKFKRIGCRDYLEHWSDPETNVISSTTVEWITPEPLVAGRNTTFGGRLVDVVGAPVKNATVNLTIAGARHTLLTNGAGEFSFAYKPQAAGELVLNVTYKGGSWYLPTSNETEVVVAEEYFQLDGGENLTILRSKETPIAGYLYVADAVRKPNVTLSFPALDTELTVPVQEDGRFETTLLVDANVTPGASRFNATGGGLKRAHGGNVTLVVQPVITIEARHAGLFTRAYEGRVNLTDEIGRPYTAPIALAVGDRWSENATGEDGLYAFSGKAPACGDRRFVAQFNGTNGYHPASASTDARVCGFLAFIPAWLLAVPWWVWPLAAALLLAAWQGYRGWRQRYAPVIMGGPAITFAFTEPNDEAAGYAAIGEAIVVTAFLEEPLPDGHRLRMGSPRRATEQPLDADLRAHYRLVPDKLGPVPLRAEILDAKGHVVSRRALTLQVVRYAEEIETRYLALRSAHGAGEAVTPREFERWLHERAPGIDPAVARRLVHVFEEADYSPRDAGRAEFAAYLMAERGVQEVSPVVRT